MSQETQKNIITANEWQFKILLGAVLCLNIACNYGLLFSSV